MRSEPINGTESSSRAALPVLRLQARSATRLTWQTDGLVTINTHWLGRRLWCSGEGCVGCQHAPSRTICYWVATIEENARRRPVLVETTPNEMARLEGFLAMDVLTMGPGLVVEASRMKARSPIRFEPMGADGVVVPDLVSPRRALAAAAVLAGVRAPRENEAVDKWVESIRDALNWKVQNATQVPQ